ncbi:MAG: hypothetical protein NC244_04480 [Alistipes senegalensis]|nr:hypothetical protein [Alistipes senegalensis]
MKYFITEEKRKSVHSTAFFEFQEGQNNEYRFTCWKENSMLLHMDLFDKSELYKIIPNLKYYGNTIVNKENWNIIKNSEKSQLAQDIIDELSEWAEENFKKYDYFVIIGL